MRASFRPVRNFVPVPSLFSYRLFPPASPCALSSVDMEQYGWRWLTDVQLRSLTSLLPLLTTRKPLYGWSPPIFALALVATLQATRIREHSMRVDSIAPPVLMNLERPVDLEHSQVYSLTRVLLIPPFSRGIFIFILAISVSFFNYIRPHRCTESMVVALGLYVAAGHPFDMCQVSSIGMKWYMLTRLLLVMENYY